MGFLKKLAELRKQEEELRAKPQETTKETPKPSVRGILFGGAARIEGRRETLDYSTALRIAQSGGRFGGRKFRGLTPGPIRTSQVTTALVGGGWEFKWYVIGGNVAGYNIYRSTINNSNVADRVGWSAQPQTATRFSQLTWQETTSDSPYYWVSAVNASGKEGPRVPMNAVNAPPQAQPATTNDIDQGERGGGGSGRRKYDEEIFDIQ